MASNSTVARGMIDLGDEMEATIVRLQLAIIAKPITAPPPVPTTADVEAMFANHYQASPQPVEISYFPPDFVLQFDNKKNYDIVLSYQILTDNKYTFSLAPWTHDARCHLEAWKIPVNIDIHGIPPHAFHPKSLSVLLDPYCDIEAYTMDKKSGICTVKGTARSVSSIPVTGFLSYPQRTGYEIVIHTFPVTMQTSLLTIPRRYSSDWHQPPHFDIQPICNNPRPKNGNNKKTLTWSGNAIEPYLKLNSKMKEE
ncbi:hypothetical protein PVAP13_1KG355405 [Panicum virgatum]|uniref:Uncharacterized protein n=2 Tax=Panicum virgatum TaxID=38727 RepID=A0A8T0XJ33_PANVG|nr:hypothetical protein PVAP13_1KG355405 [Panicum virgatum]KAG2659417.1 hypothetical protein PVAP13_1KG355405 [Panicum virgatum]KAG2659418.1 hypothetical protein PVAP13_1KG355405 [Panicum virgatum]